MFHVKHPSLNPTPGGSRSWRSLGARPRRYQSEVRAFGRNSHSPRILVRAELALAYYLHASGGLLRRFKAEFRQALNGPAIDLLRGFTNDENATDTKQWRRTFGDSGRRAEQPCRNRVDRAPPCRITAHVLGTSVQNDDPVIPAQRLNRFLEECDPTFEGIKKNDSEIGTGIGDHETRDSATGTEIDNHRTYRHLIQCGQKAGGMRDVTLDRTGTEHSEAASPIQGHLQTC
jgi:hypothetical protein